MEKLITVIIPAYNAQNTIENAVKSAINEDTEIIIVNDGSTDDTIKICEKLKNENIKVINQENKGTFYARKAGINVAKGKYTMFLDADDIYLENTISRVKEVIKKYNEPDLIRFRYKKEPDGYEQYKYAEEAERKVLKQDFKNEVYPFFIKGYMLNAVWSNCTKSSILKNIEIKGEVTRSAEDMLFNLELFSNIDNLIFLEDILYQYNYTPNSITNSKEKSKLISKLKDAIQSYSLLYKYLFIWDMCDEKTVEQVTERVKKETYKIIDVLNSQK